MSQREHERVLVEGCRSGDERAWRALYRAYGGDIAFFIHGMVAASSDVDDLVQKVFLEFVTIPRAVLSFGHRFIGSSGVWRGFASNSGVVGV